MEIGIGLPNAVSGTTRHELLNWGRAAEDAGFSSLGTIDRIVYPNYEPLMALAAIAAVTERIRLATTVMLGPLRANAALVAKQILSLDAVAGGGRAVLGIGLGGRADDYEVSKTSLSSRGAWQDSALAKIRGIFDGGGEIEAKIGPRPLGDPPRVILGGTVEASFTRAARYGDGWINGGGGPDQFVSGREQLLAAWDREGREGQAYSMSLVYFSLGDDAEANANRYLLDYYGFLGEQLSGTIARSAAKNPDTVKQYVSAFEAAGCDELVIFPCSAELDQIELLADAIGRR
jgi:alkanesulfonate monooxygenase SsuD/methylene tetrahydromethanopterin reductase-like flavin-dependent oxidoreductase (luciferase family)